MKALEASKLFFTQEGLPALQAACPEMAGRLAAGFVGRGSECFFYDDEFSKDHDYGVGFCIWLNQEDFQNYGAVLQKAYAKLPDTFSGFEVRKPQIEYSNRVGVFEVNEFYRQLIGCKGIPETNMVWFVLKEENLASAVNGMVFMDETGEFSAVRRRLRAFYPLDVRLRKMADACFAVSQSGQYNYERSVQRQDKEAAYMCINLFVRESVHLAHLIAGIYMPFYKWAFRSLEELPIDRSIASQLKSIISKPVFDESIPGLIEQVCTSFAIELNNGGFTQTSTNYLIEHSLELNRRITDKSLKQTIF